MTKKSAMRESEAITSSARPSPIDSKRGSSERSWNGITATDGPAVRLHRDARRPGPRLRRRPGAERAHRALAVAQALLAQVLDRGLDAAGELVAHLRRDDGLAGIGELGEAAPRR